MYRIVQITLLSDGSVTRHLQLMTGQTVTVECLEMQDVGLFSAQSIPGKAYIPQMEEEFRTVRRQVFLQMSDEVERPYVYASSWWRRDVVDEYLKDKSKPIWTSLSSERTELFREIIEVEHGYCGELERYAVVDHVLDVGIFFPPLLSPTAGILDARAHSGRGHTSSGTIKNPSPSSMKSFPPDYMNF